MTTVHSRRIDGPVDLFDVAGADGWLFVRDGVGVAGRGSFTSCDSRAVREVLAELGARVFAIGARPFDPRASWDLVVPRVQVRVEADGSVIQTWLGEPDETDPPPLHDQPSQSGPRVEADGTARIEVVDDPDTWCDTVAKATAEIRRGRVDKVVVSREVIVEHSGPIDPSTVVGALRERFGSCYVYQVDGLVGASPELLVERDGDTVRSQPMAGTARRSNDPATDATLHAELLGSPTYRREHQLTIDMVRDTLLGFSSYIDFEPEPSIVDLANVAHLATRVEGHLSSPAASVLDLVNALHPTPAVSGRPRDAAVGLIGELEARDRGRYAGTVGWVDGAGNGTWAVTIRCAQIDPADPRRARVHAGCGLVADSEPRRELAESEAKLDAMLSVMGLAPSGVSRTGAQT